MSGKLNRRRTASTGTEVVLVVSVDTEEDNWTPARRGVSVDNIRELPRFHGLLRGLGIKPTYFTTYQVAKRPWAVELLRGLSAGGQAEVAAHLHPWNTPPLDEKLIPRNTMLWNLPLALQQAKLRHLTTELTEVLDSAPTSFRAGRFGLGPGLIPALVAQGYRVDSSVTPYCSWEAYDHGPSFIGAPVVPYRLGDGGTNPVTAVQDGPLVELPVSCGFNRTPFGVWSPVHRLLVCPPLRAIRAPGIASRLGVLRKIILSPEGETLADMLTLSKRLLEQGSRYLHLFLHSSSLRAGLSPFAPTAASVDRIYQVISDYVEGVSRMASIRSATVSEAAEFFVPSRLKAEAS